MMYHKSMSVAGCTSTEIAWTCHTTADNWSTNSIIQYEEGQLDHFMLSCLSYAHGIIVSQIQAINLPTRKILMEVLLTFHWLKLYWAQVKSSSHRLSRRKLQIGLALGHIILWADLLLTICILIISVLTIELHGACFTNVQVSFLHCFSIVSAFKAIKCSSKMIKLISGWNIIRTHL